MLEEQLSAGARAELLRVLTSPPEVRAHVIRQFFERPSGSGMGDVLIDLEEDDFVRATFIATLRRMEQEGHAV